MSVDPSSVRRAADLVEDLLRKLYDGNLQGTPWSISVIRDAAEKLELLAAYEATGLTPEEIVTKCHALAEGRLLVLPCKTGGTAYYSDEDTGRVLMGYVASVSQLYDGATYFEFANVESDIEWVSVELPLSDFSKTVFLTREEAEIALKGGEMH